MYHTHVGAHRGCKRALDSLDLELPAAAVWVLGAPLEEQSVLLTAEPLFHWDKRVKSYDLLM